MVEPRMMRELFDYVGFDEAHAEALARLAPALRPSFEGIVDDFYRAVESNPRALAVFEGGRAQIAHQKERLFEWLEGVVGGVYDDAYFARRARIGRAHVRSDLDQRFVFGAMSIVRSGLRRAIDAAGVPEEERARGQAALDAILDVELAIMLETFREHHVEQQRAQERLATLGEIAASIGHELRNPLAVIETSAHLLRGHVGEDQPKAMRHLDRIRGQIDVSKTIIGNLLALVRRPELRREPVALAELAEDALSALPRWRGVRVGVDAEPELPAARVDRNALRQVLVNLVSNAGQALEEAGRDGTVELRFARSGDALILEVRDDGPGFDPELRGVIFQPLVTTRATGIGLGLSITQRLVAQHGGTIRASTPPEGGALVTVELPAAFGGGEMGGGS